MYCFILVTVMHILNNKECLDIHSFLVITFEYQIMLIPALIKDTTPALLIQVKS